VRTGFGLAFFCSGQGRRPAARCCRRTCTLPVIGTSASPTANGHLEMGPGKGTTGLAQAGGQHGVPVGLVAARHSEAASAPAALALIGSIPWVNEFGGLWVIRPRLS